MDETSHLGFFAGETRKFWLPMPRVIAAEREMSAAIGQLYVDLGQNIGMIADNPVIVAPMPARLKHCQILIENALIGAGVAEEEASALVATYCYPARPAIRDFELAYRILHAAIHGMDLGESKKNDVAPEEAPGSTKAE